MIFLSKEMVHSQFGVFLITNHFPFSFSLHPILWLIFSSMHKTLVAWSHLVSYQKVSTQIVCRGQHELSFRQNLLTVSQNMLIGGFYTKKQIDQPIYQLFTKITKQLSKAQCCQKILCTSQRSWWKGSDGCKEKKSVRKNTNRKKTRNTCKSRFMPKILSRPALEQLTAGRTAGKLLLTCDRGSPTWPEPPRNMICWKGEIHVTNSTNTSLQNDAAIGQCERGSNHKSENWRSLSKKECFFTIIFYRTQIWS